MRKIIWLVIFSIPFLLITQSKANEATLSDTSKIVHIIDGNLSEWNLATFETDKETQLIYSFDHDKNYLFLALKVNSVSTQMKMIRQGMSLFLDKKGKKREGMGVIFPLPQGNSLGNYSSGGNGNASQPSNRPTPLDPKLMHENLSRTMILLKVFGFDDQEDKMQIVDLPGNVNISFEWNDANELIIEYLIPISFLGKPADLNNKPIGIGWKINGMSIPGSGFQNGNSASSSSSGAGGVTASIGGSKSGASARSTTNVNFQSTDPRMKEQFIWTKYVLTF